MKQCICLEELKKTCKRTACLEVEISFCLLLLLLLLLLLATAKYEEGNTACGKQVP